MNVNLYLPDEIGRHAKDADLPLSQLLREAVVSELERRETVAQTLSDSKEWKLDLYTDNGERYTGRLVGRQIGYDVRSQVMVYLADDERVIVHDGENGRIYEISNDPQVDLETALRNWLSDDDAYVEAMDALGLKAVIDL